MHNYRKTSICYPMHRYTSCIPFSRHLMPSAGLRAMQVCVRAREEVSLLLVHVYIWHMGIWNVQLRHVHERQSLRSKWMHTTINMQARNLKEVCTKHSRQCMLVCLHHHMLSTSSPYAFMSVCAFLFTSSYVVYIITYILTQPVFL